MVRYNKLKIFILAGEAKPGGTIGAMLSPYLFSANMSDFCKKFNDLSKDYSSGVYLPVKIYCDTLSKTYSFFLKGPSLPLLLNYFFSNKVSLTVLEFYDLVLYCHNVYGFDMVLSSFIMLGVLRSYRRNKRFFFCGECIGKKLIELKFNNA
jgi:hypothetical protein